VVPAFLYGMAKRVRGGVEKSALQQQGGAPQRGEHQEGIGEVASAADPHCTEGVTLRSWRGGLSFSSNSMGGRFTETWVHLRAG